MNSALMEGLPQYFWGGVRVPLRLQKSAASASLGVRGGEDRDRLPPHARWLSLRKSAKECGLGQKFFLVPKHLRTSLGTSDDKPFSTRTHRMPGRAASRAGPGRRTARVRRCPSPRLLVVLLLVQPSLGDLGGVDALEAADLNQAGDELLCVLATGQPHRGMASSCMSRLAPCVACALPCVRSRACHALSCLVSRDAAQWARSTIKSNTFTLTKK